jgi:hypothetical protein
MLQWPLGSLPRGYVMRLRTGQSGFASRPLSGSIVTVTVATAAGCVSTGVELESTAGTASSRVIFLVASVRTRESDWVEASCSG